MITAFFKPKTKVQPAPSLVSSTTTLSTTTQSSSSSKRSREEEAPSNKKKQKFLSEEVKDLLAHLDSSSEDNDWSVQLEKHFASPSFERLAKFVAQQR